MTYKLNSIKYKLLSSLLIASTTVIAGCGSTNFLNSSQIYQEGYILDPSALDTVSVGSSQEQVLLALGSPSLKTKYNNEVFYYISQTRHRGMQFMKTRIINRKVLAIYFNKNHQVAKIAHYGLQDGRIFDFISRTTPTTIQDHSFLTQIINGYTKTVKLPTTNR
ncbi:outer membrane protein assembly factor BamE [Bartonella sp. F2]|nr:outer membrane protein assembly factor BamE [Bartonella sp. F02]MCZ2328317.1 outer membrane protein assembly factor BamE [Bartonella sp. F02]